MTPAGRRLVRAGAASIAAALGLVFAPGAANHAATAATAATAGPAVTVLVEQRDGAPLPDAVLTAQSLDGAPLPAPSSAVLDQRDKKFVPQVLVVQSGATVRFTNSDSVSHHVYSISPAKRFQDYLEKSEPPRSLVFDQPGIVTLGCNLHDWMLAYIAVVPTPHFVKTDANGRAALAGLAPGRYALELWHPRSTDPPARLRREVTLGRDGITWNVRLERPLLPSRDQVPTFDY